MIELHNLTMGKVKDKEHLKLCPKHTESVEAFGVQQYISTCAKPARCVS